MAGCPSIAERLLCSFVYAHGDCSQDEAARALQMDKTTVAKSLKQLETRGLTRRESNPADRRKNCLRITESGKRSIAPVVEAGERWLSAVFAALTEEEQIQFEACCQRLLHAAEALEEGETT